MYLIAKHKFSFIVLNVGILIATPIEAHRLPVKYQLLVGLIAFVVFNELTMNRQHLSLTPAVSPTPSAAPEARPLPVAQAAQPTGPGGAKSLAVVLSAPSWLRVTVDGNVSMEGTYPAGTSKTFHGTTALVRIGNAGGVEIYVDGKDRGKLGKSGDVVEHSFAL